MPIHRNLSIGLLVFSATLSLQSCDPVSSEKEQPSGPCFRAMRAMRSACAETGGSTNPPPPPAATATFQASFAVADTSRVPDSVHVSSRGQIAPSPKLIIKENALYWTVVVTAVFDRPVQVPDTVFVRVFKKSIWLGTVKSLNLSGGWTVVSVDRDTASQPVFTGSWDGHSI